MDSFFNYLETESNGYVIKMNFGHISVCVVQSVINIRWKMNLGKFTPTKWKSKEYT